MEKRGGDVGRGRRSERKVGGGEWVEMEKGGRVMPVVGN